MAISDKIFFKCKQSIPGLILPNVLFYFSQKVLQWGLQI